MAYVTDQVINIEEAAAKNKCTKAYMARMARVGRVPGARLMGKQWIFPQDVKILDVDEWKALGLDKLESRRSEE